MSGTPAWKHFYGFGIEPMLELPWDDQDDELATAERIRSHGMLDTDTDGSVLATGSPADRHPYYAAAKAGSDRSTPETTTTYRPSPKAAADCTAAETATHPTATEPAAQASRDASQIGARVEA